MGYTKIFKQNELVAKFAEDFEIDVDSLKEALHEYFDIEFPEDTKMYEDIAVEATAKYKGKFFKKVLVGVGIGYIKIEKIVFKGTSSNPQFYVVGPRFWISELQKAGDCNLKYESTYYNFFIGNKIQKCEDFDEFVVDSREVLDSVDANLRLLIAQAKEIIE